MYEILEKFKIIPLNTEFFNSLNFQDNTKHYISCIDYYIKTKWPKTKFSCQINSLNKYDIFSIEKQIKNIKKHLWHKPLNLIIFWSKKNKKIKNKIIWQQNDISKLIFIIELWKINISNCIVKCKSPFLTKNIDSFDSINFIISLLYIYYIHFKKIYIFKPSVSDSTKSDYYIIGKNFKGIQNINLKEKIKLFKLNDILIETPSWFTINIFIIFWQIFKYNSHHIDYWNIYLQKQIINDKDSNIKIEKIMHVYDEKKYYDIWIKQTKFKFIS